MAREYFDKSEQADQIEMKIGDAMELIPQLKEDWDLVFIDADKINYGNYYDLVIDGLKAGAWIIADNVLWSGKVLMDDADLDPDTLAIKHFNAKVKADPRVETTLLPFRDGLLLIRKK